MYYSLPIFFIISILVVSCGGQDLKNLDQVHLSDKAGIERATSVELLYSDSATIRVQVLAPVLLRYTDPRNPKQVFTEGIEANFFDENQKQTSKLQSKYAEQYTKNRKVFLKDSVHVWNNKKEHLEAEELIWDESQKKIYSDKFVKITTPTQIISGYHLVSNLEFTEWELDSVSGIIESKNMMDSPF